MEIGVHIHKRIVAYLRLAWTILHGILSESRTIVGCVVVGEVMRIGTKVALQHARYHKAQVQIGVDVQSGHRQHCLIRRLLERNNALPINRTEGHILLQTYGEETYRPTRLFHAERVLRAQMLIGYVVSHCEVGVVLQLIERHTQLCACLVVSKGAL